MEPRSGAPAGPLAAEHGAAEPAATSLPAALPEGEAVFVAEGEAEAKKKRLNLLGFQFAASEQKLKNVLVGTGFFMVALNCFGLPFALPKLRRFLGAPYVPMKRMYVEMLFDQMLPAWNVARLPAGAAAAAEPAAAEGAEASLAGLRLVDLGSGDGRLIRAAANAGMVATGYELNPYLVGWSRLRLTGAGVAPGSATVRWVNIWQADLRNTDIVTVYGRPGDGLMERIVAKCEAELPPHAVVVSHFFDMPGWDRIMVQNLQGLKLYDLSRLDRGESSTSDAADGYIE